MTETLKVIVLVCGAGVTAAFLTAVFAMFAGARITMPPEVTYEDLDPDETGPVLTMAPAPYAHTLRVRPYVAAEPDPDLTGPLQSWERPVRPTKYRSMGRNADPERTAP